MKKMLCILLAIAFLCGCQAESVPDSSGSLSALTQSASSESLPTDSSKSTPCSESVPTAISSSGSLLPVPPVCDVPFTQTESFPMPFEDELLIDNERGLLLSTEQALYDYDTMWLLLEENFPYLNVMKTEMGIDWENIKEDYRQRLAGRAIDNYISQKNFMLTINRCLREFYSVGHLFMVDNRTYLTELFPTFNGPLFQRIVQLIDNPKSDLFYSYAEPMRYEIRRSSPSKSTAPEPVTIPDENMHKITPTIMTGYVGEDIPYLRIASFSDWPEGVHTALSEFFVDIASEKHLIIDVRGNGGGNTKCIRSIVPLLEHFRLEHRMFFGAKSGSLNLALYPEIFGDGSDVFCYTDDTWQRDFPYIPPDALEGVDIHLKCRQPFEKDYTQQYFNGKIWVLIDGGCYSTTDYFVCFCKETGFATLVGTTTGGNGKGSQPYYMALPYSGLLVEYEPYLTFNLDGTCNGITGTPPDIPCREGMDALETCLQAIQEYETAS